MWCSTSITAIEPRSARMQLAELAQLVRVEPACRLVEQQQLGLADQRARQRHALLHRVGQRRRQPVGDVLAAELRADAAARRSRSARSSRSERGSPSSALATPARAKALGADHHVLEHAQAGEQPHPLQRARDPDAGAGGSVRTRRASAPATRSCPTCGSHEPADDVEQRRLARAVGADHAEHLARLDVQRDAVERGDPAEAHRQLPRREPTSPVRLTSHLHGSYRHLRP